MFVEIHGKFHVPATFLQISHHADCYDMRLAVALAGLQSDKSLNGRRSGVSERRVSDDGRELLYLLHLVPPKAFVLPAFRHI